ncbi:MAG TPA: hypothetical protein VGF97_14070 [Rhizomicrobium sp.]
MPRSGTTILARLMANHSRVRRIIEPYQTKRSAGYDVTSVGALCADFGVKEESGFSLLVKETTTRGDNIRLLHQLMEGAALENYRVGYVLVLRSPLEAFLSQVDAAQSLWTRKSAFSRDRASLKAFWNVFVASIGIHLEHALRFHRRIAFYDAFALSPRSEIARLMGLFGYPIEPDQLRLSEDAEFGGDPGAGAATDNFLPRTDRSSAIESMAREFGSLAEFGKMWRLHEYTKDALNYRKSSDAIVRDLALLVQMP